MASETAIWLHEDGPQLSIIYPQKGSKSDTRCSFHHMRGWGRRMLAIHVCSRRNQGSCSRRRTCLGRRAHPSAWKAQVSSQAWEQRSKVQVVAPSACMV